MAAIEWERPKREVKLHQQVPEEREKGQDHQVYTCLGPDEQEQSEVTPLKRRSPRKHMPTEMKKVPDYRDAMAPPLDERCNSAPRISPVKDFDFQ